MVGVTRGYTDFFQGGSCRISRTYDVCIHAATLKSDRVKLELESRHLSGLDMATKRDHSFCAAESNLPRGVLCAQSHLKKSLLEIFQQKQSPVTASRSLRMI